MACRDRNSYHEAALLTQRDRQKVAIERLEWLACNFENPDLLNVSGNERILEMRDAAKRCAHYNFVTTATMVGYEADYAESRLCAAIKAVDESRLLDMLTSELTTSKFCRNFLDWYEEHKAEDEKRVKDEKAYWSAKKAYWSAKKAYWSAKKAYWSAKVRELESELETAKSELKN